MAFTEGLSPFIYQDIQDNSRREAISSVEEEAPIKPGDYIRGNIHQGGEEIKQHEGVVIGPGEKGTFRVVDPGDDFDGGGHFLDPHYTVHDVEEKDAEVVDVPGSKYYHVESVRDQLEDKY